MTPAAVAEPPDEDGRALRANVIILSIDSLRADRLGAYGYERPTSPTIDMLARNGIRFANAHAEAPWTLPSHMTLMSGRFPSAHGATEFGRRLPDEIPTLAEVMQQNGYRTFAYTTGGFVGSVYGFGRGFESYFEELRPLNGLLNRAIERIEALAPEERYLLFLQTFQVHCPYQVTERYALRFQTRPSADHLDTRGKCSRDYLKMGLSIGQMQFIADMYDAGIAQADGALQHLATFLHKRRAWRDTIFILLSDHGDEFGEHGSIGHGTSLYDEVMHVPLVILAPGFAPRVVEERVGLVDVMPTVLDLVGIAPPPEMQGRSLVPLLAGEPGQAGSVDAHFAEATTSGSRLRSIVSGGWKLIVDMSTGTTELFDLARDPEERSNLAGEHPARVAALEQRLRAHFDALPAPRPESALPTRQNLDQLRALGYIDDEAGD